jgi:putative ABC transport system permease protein
LRVNRYDIAADQRAQAEQQLNMIAIMLLAMSILLAIVGGLGLMGTMSINVIERTKEIGVMRAIGASSRAVQQIVLVEGILIGGMSWALGTLVAYPLSRLLSNVLGSAVIQSSLTYVFDIRGPGLWLLIVMVLASLASYLPARRASKVAVHDVLAYE